MVVVTLKDAALAAAAAAKYTFTPCPPDATNLTESRDAIIYGSGQAAVGTFIEYKSEDFVGRNGENKGKKFHNKSVRMKLTQDYPCLKKSITYSQLGEAITYASDVLKAGQIVKFTLRGIDASNFAKVMELIGSTASVTVAEKESMVIDVNTL